MRPSILGTLALAGMIVLVPGIVFPASIAVSAQVRPQGEPGDHALVASIQELLATLGYDPGPADGVMGRRTRRAIIAFQRRQGLPADGRPSEALFRRLTEALSRSPAEAAPAAPPAATVEPAAVRRGPASGGNMPHAERAEKAAEKVAIAAAAQAPAAAKATGSLAGSRWAVQDSNGARFRILFEEDGKIAGVTYPRFWQWAQSAGTVRITYDNGWGVRVVRTGSVENGTMTGTARGPRGRKWTWRARRLPVRPPPPAPHAPRRMP